MNIITLKPCPEIRYVFIENIHPSNLPLSSSGSMTLTELSQFLSNRSSIREKRQRRDSGSDIPEKRLCCDSNDDNCRQEVHIIEEQARLIDYYRNKF